MEYFCKLYLVNKSISYVTTYPDLNMKYIFKVQHTLLKK